MQVTRSLLALVAGSALCLVGGLAFAAVRSAPWFQEAVEPLEQHELVQEGVGEWSGTMTMHMPGMPEPMKWPCSESVAAVGELWTVSTFEMDMMGMPFTGSSTFGYDPAKEKFVGTWVDSMTTTLTLMEGEWDDEAGAIVMHYDMADEAGKLRPVRLETTTGDDAYSSKFYDVSGEAPALMMQIDMQRKGQSAIDAGSSK